MQARILVVDDTPAIADVLQLMLKRAGYAVLITGDGTEVMHLVQDWHPNLVLLDVWIPGTDGQELCIQLKQQERLKQIPLLLMSAHHDLQQVSEQAGADGYLRKPFTKNVLLSTIALALQPQTLMDH